MPYMLEEKGVGQITCSRAACQKEAALGLQGHTAKSSPSDPVGQRPAMLPMSQGIGVAPNTLEQDMPTGGGIASMSSYSDKETASPASGYKTPPVARTPSWSDASAEHSTMEPSEKSQGNHTPEPLMRTPSWSDTPPGNFTMEPRSTSKGEHMHQFAFASQPGQHAQPYPLQVPAVAQQAPPWLQATPALSPHVRPLWTQNASPWPQPVSQGSLHPRGQQEDNTIATGESRSLPPKPAVRPADTEPILKWFPASRRRAAGYHWEFHKHSRGALPKKKARCG